MKINIIGRINIMRQLLVLVLIALAVSCKTEDNINSKEKILVNIDNKVTISLNEFIRRAEYTVRPNYCKQNKYLQKKIILNSLIAEKLMALEMEENQKVVEDKEFQNYLKGRKEQSMRQLMFHNEATAKVKIDTSEIKLVYKNANREYQVQHFVMNKSEVEAKLNNNLSSNDFIQLYKTKWSDREIPTKEVSWGSSENSKILKALFQQEIKKDQVLGPIELNNEDYLFIKVSGWSDQKSITEYQIQNRLTDVTETLTTQKASAIWSNVVGEVMRGKNIEFFAEVSKKVKEIFKQRFFKTDKEKKELLKQEMFSQEINGQSILEENIEKDLMNQPFFKINDEIWTVNDFRNLVNSHPLVFREMRIPSDKFAEQFKLAVVDLMEDYYITQEAYKKGYQNSNLVNRNVNMWKDSFLSMYHKNEYLSRIGEKRNFSKNHIKIIEEKLNPYIKSLQKKYYKKIELDFAEFEKIQLATIDLFVKQPKQAYKMVVPMFPTLTNDHSLEYLTKMKK